MGYVVAAWEAVLSQAAQGVEACRDCVFSGVDCITLSSGVDISTHHWYNCKNKYLKSELQIIVLLTLLNGDRHKKIGQLCRKKSMGLCLDASHGTMYTFYTIE